VANSQAFNAAAAKAAIGKSVKQDDLKVVEGIGPKIEQMFHAAGIPTWKALSETPVARCQEILDGGGNRYKVHQPGSWPMQAKMAYEGKWVELAKWQDEHGYGKL
jgi:predicted flap endonuclease-1-like 5' DNA nuclease